MTDVQITLLELIKATLFQTEPHFPESVDWDQVYEEAISQTVLGLAAPSVPQSEARRWQLAAAQNQAQFMRLLYAQSQLVRLFEKHGVPMVILKGTAAAIYYPVPYYRSFGDVDFLVPPERFEEARTLMEENGYCIQEDNGRHIGYEKNGIEFELHRRFSNDEYNIEPLLLDGMKHIDIREINQMFFPTLPDDENGLVLLGHIRQHIRGTGLGLRQVIDWMMFVHSELNDTVRESRFQAVARETGFEPLAVTVTTLCKKYLGLPNRITWCDSADEELVDAVLQHLFDNGNFGQKRGEEYRSVDSLSRNIKKEGVFRYLQRAGLINWPAAREHAFLRPFAWLYQIARYIHKGIAAFFLGERFKKGIDSTRKKQSILKQLGIDPFA